MNRIVNASGVAPHYLVRSHRGRRESASTRIARALRIERCLRLRSRRCRVKDVARSIGVSTRTVHRWTTRALRELSNGPVRSAPPASPRTKDRREECLRLRAAGMRVVDVARELRVSTRTVKADTAAALREVRERTTLAAVLYREVSLRQYDAIIAAWLPRADEKRGLDVVLAAISGRARLLGLYHHPIPASMPVRLRIVYPDGRVDEAK